MQSEGEKQWTPWLPGTVAEGTGSASGTRRSRDIGGTIAAQKPLFLERGLDLSWAHNGTVNLGIRPFEFVLDNPRLTLTDVRWLSGYPAENFSFADCQLKVAGRIVDALLYYPRPETKAAFGRHPGNAIMEILAPFLPGVGYGMTIEVRAATEQLHFKRSEEPG